MQTRAATSNTRFLVTDAAGKPVTAVCPGATYTVTVRPGPEGRQLLVRAPAKQPAQARRGKAAASSPGAGARLSHCASTVAPPGSHALPVPVPVPPGANPLTAGSLGPPPQLSFPEKRMALLTASAGAWAKPGDEECPNRVFFDRSGGFASETKQTMALTVPCTREAPDGGPAACGCCGAPNACGQQGLGQLVACSPIPPTRAGPAAAL
jgi:hypothetical protein